VIVCLCSHNVHYEQKARIALARLVYANADVAVMDDPLSAVDVHVGQHLWQHCIKGALAGKTRLLVTHQLQFLPDCDRVIVMDNGRIAHMGTFQQLTAAGVDLTAYMTTAPSPKETDSGSHGTQDGDDSAKVADVSVALASLGNSTSMTSAVAGDGTGAVDGHDQTGRQGSALTDDVDTPAGPPASITTPTADLATAAPAAALTTPKSGTPVAGPAGSKLMTREHRVEGAVGKNVFKTYFTAAGSCSLAYVAIASVIISVASRVAPDVWLSYWVKDSVQAEPTNSQTLYVWVYAVLVGILIIARLVEGIVFALLTTSASRNLHNICFERVLHGTMAYFDTTPLGRILNRFSGDLDQV
jgi:hypothetical protein